MTEYKDVVECARWSAVPNYLERLAFILDLTLEMKVQNGLLRQTILFKVIGDDQSVDKFKNQFHKDARAYTSIVA